MHQAVSNEGVPRPPDHCVVSAAACPAGAPDLRVEPLFDDELWLVGRKGDPQLKAKAVNVTPLLTGRLLRLEEGHCPRDHALHACGAATHLSTEGVEATSLLTLVQMVDSGLGVALLAERGSSGSRSSPGKSRRGSPTDLRGTRTRRTGWSHSHSIINGACNPWSLIDIFSSCSSFTVRFFVNFIRSPKSAFSIYRQVSRWIDAPKRSAFRIVRDVSASIAGGALPVTKIFRIYRRLSKGTNFRLSARVESTLAYSPVSMCRRLVPGRFCPRFDFRQSPRERCLRKLCVVVGL
jgi:hypothetical protein